jgi:hypothetical protein
LPVRVAGFGDQTEGMTMKYTVKIVDHSIQEHLFKTDSYNRALEIAEYYFNKGYYSVVTRNDEIIAEYEV